MLIGVLIVLSCIVVLLLGFYAFFVYSVKTMHTSQTLAENIQISSEPTEITLEKPLKGKKLVQQIALSIEGYKPKITDQGFVIKLTDGTIVNPQIEVVDENGNVYPLEKNGRTFTGNGDLVDVRFGGIDGMSVPGNLAYKTVRISSDKPFRCNIYWKDYDLK